METVEKQFDDCIREVEDPVAYLRMIEEEDNPEDLYLNVLDKTGWGHLFLFLHYFSKKTKK